MMITPGLIAVALIALGSHIEADFLARVESDRLMGGDGTTIPRVERDADGNVVRLQLNRMQLTGGDSAALGRLTTLRSLTLFETNVTDTDLQQLRGLTRLEHLNLTSTETTDEAVNEITRLESLRSLCLGSVNITPEAVARLKAHFQSKEKKLSLGYSRRK